MDFADRFVPDIRPGETITMGEMCDAAWPATESDLHRDIVRLLETERGLWVQCMRRATAKYRYSCIHEHMADRQTCDEHKPEPDAVGCRNCFELGHDCPMTFQQIELL